MDSKSKLEMEAFIEWKSVPEEKLFGMTHYYQRDATRKYPHAKLMFVTDRKGDRCFVGVFNSPLELNHKLNFDTRKQSPPQLLGGRLFWYADNYPEAAKLRIFCEAWLCAAYEAVLGRKRPQTWETSTDGLQR
jgi:hypothetical protein